MADRDIEFRYLCKNWYENWCFHFDKIYDHQSWQAIYLFTGFDSIETIQTCASDITTSRSRYKIKIITTTRVPMATKLGRMVTYCNRFMHINSHDPLITSSCEITWPFKTTISTIWVSMATKLARMVTWWAPAQKVIWNFNHKILWAHMTIWNHYMSTTAMPMATKLGKLVTCHKGLLLNVTPSFDHVVLRDRVTN